MSVNSAAGKANVSMLWVAIFVVILIWIAIVSGVRAQSSDEVIHVCVAGNGQMRFAAASTACRRGETLVSWNVKGDKGDKGDQGAQGVQGIQGVKGDTGAPGTVSLADGRCWSNVLRYVDCGNGTVTDQVTGLIWLKDASCLVPSDYATANQNAQILKHGDCNLTDHSVAGQWRLPTQTEWAATIKRAVVQGCVGGMAPALTNDLGTGCYSVGPSAFSGVHEDYWSSSTNDGGGADGAWYVGLFAGNLNFVSGKSSIVRVWPVRGAPF
jgi:hypothetical protein